MQTAAAGVGAGAIDCTSRGAAADGAADGAVVATREKKEEMGEATVEVSMKSLVETAMRVQGSASPPFCRRASARDTSASPLGVAAPPVGSVQDLHAWHTDG